MDANKATLQLFIMTTFYFDDSLQVIVMLKNHSVYILVPPGYRNTLFHLYLKQGRSLECLASEQPRHRAAEKPFVPVWLNQKLFVLYFYPLRLHYPC